MKLFVDWGTSNVRAWSIDASGTVVDRHASNQGLRATETVGFERGFDQILGKLGADRKTTTLIFGMAGSKSGWKEVPYAPTPANAASIARQAKSVDGHPSTWIVGGVSHDGKAGPEVMRGEEVQTLGVLHMQPGARSLCLPGTHTKWVRTNGEAITSFSTYMTGELFGWVTEHSIISTEIGVSEFDRAGFELGLALARGPLAFTAALFQLRTRFLSGDIEADQVGSVASGLLIGHELASVGPSVEGTTYVCAAPRLVEPYRVAFDDFGLDCVFVDPEQAAIAGLLTLSPLIEQ